MATTSPSPCTSAPDNITARWVKILSSTPLMEAQNSLLARGPNFALVLRYSPTGEYIATVKVCLKLFPRVAAESKTETSHLLRKDCSPTLYNQGRDQGPLGA